LRRKKVVVCGSFEILHPGHVHLIKEASKYGSVTVVVARDSTIKTVKGRDPIIPEEQRLFMVKSIKWVEDAVLGSEEGDKLKVIEELKPDIILLGPDQDYDPKELERELKARGLKVKVLKLKSLYTDYPLYKTSRIVERILALYS